MKDVMLGLCFMVAGIVTIYVARQYPTMPSLQFGPSLFPSLIGGGFFIGGLVLAASQFSTLRQRASEHRMAWSIDYQAILVSLLPCGLIVFYILASDYLGTAISLATMMFVLMLVRRTPWLLALGVSVAASLVIYFVFSRYLLIPLPEGLLSVGG
jgi:putative tricarboxylic transport membrane protein